MRYPINDWSRWYSAQSFGNKTTYGLPFLKIWILSKIGLVMYPHVATITNCFKIILARISSIHIYMMNQKWLSFSIVANFHKIFSTPTAKFAKIFSKLRVHHSPIFIIMIFISPIINFTQRNFKIINSFIREIGTFIRTVFGHFTSINFISRSNKRFLTVQTLKYMPNSPFWHSRFLTKSFPYKINHTLYYNGLHEGVNT